MKCMRHNVCDTMYATQDGMYATEVYATEVYATEVYATEVYATEVYATEVYAKPDCPCSLPSIPCLNTTNMCVRAQMHEGLMSMSKAP